MKSSGQTREPTPIPSFSEPTEPIARTRSQPASSRERRLAAWSIRWGGLKAGAAVALEDAGVVGGGGRRDPLRRGPVALLPSTTAKRPIGRS